MGGNMCPNQDKIIITPLSIITRYTPTYLAEWRDARYKTEIFVSPVLRPHTPPGSNYCDFLTQQYTTRTPRDWSFSRGYRVGASLGTR